MNESVAIWNTLHDGEITVLEKEGDTLTLFVSIPYLRDRIKPLGDSFVIKLIGIRSIRFSDFEGKKVSEDWRELAHSGIEILSTDSIDVPVRICTTLGFLDIDFDAMEIFLDTGGAIEYPEVLRACECYWDEWSKQQPRKDNGS